MDRELMSLLNQRARLALDIGRLKKNAGLPVFVPERESDLLDKLAQGNHGPLPNRYLVSVFREVISACRSVQQPLKVAFLGPEFTFSHQAAVQHFGSSCGMAPRAASPKCFARWRAAAARWAWCRWRTPARARWARLWTSS